MTETKPEYTLTRTEEVSVATVEAVEAWTRATTDADSDASQRSMVNKGRRVLDFFQVTGTKPETATPMDVKKWQEALKQRGEKGLANSTIYSYTSFLSSFYNWALQNEKLANALPYGNITDLHKPKPPKPYKGAKALAPEEVNALVDVVRRQAKHSLTAKRDLALLYFFLLTGRRRAEICRLRWRDVKRLNGQTRVHFVVKGGDEEERIVPSVCHELLLAYLREAGRLDDMEPDTPLWTSHDRSGTNTGALSSHAFAKNLKRYSDLAGLEEDVHVHMLRHTVGDALYQLTGDIGAVQFQLGHKNQQTSRIYVHSIATKPDRYSGILRDVFGL